MRASVAVIAPLPLLARYCFVNVTSELTAGNPPVIVIFDAAGAISVRSSAILTMPVTASSASKARMRAGPRNQNGESGCGEWGHGDDILFFVALESWRSRP